MVNLTRTWHALYACMRAEEAMVYFDQGVAWLGSRPGHAMAGTPANRGRADAVQHIIIIIIIIVIIIIIMVRCSTYEKANKIHNILRECYA